VSGLNEIENIQEKGKIGKVTERGILKILSSQRAHISDGKTLINATDGHYSSLRYLDISEGSSIHHTASELLNVPTEEVIEESFGLAD
jgi:hypothetical protein